MKVIGGQAKGKKLHQPNDWQYRATTDSVKESLFNILPSMEGKYFLDLFAGTGNVGIEAASRGATKVVFVESNPLSVRAIKKNVKLCQYEGISEILSVAVDRGINMLLNRKAKFDVIFSDPPYEQSYVDRTLHALDSCSLLSEYGIVAFEHSIREQVEENTRTLILFDQRRYGDTVISFYEGRNREKDNRK